MITNLHPYSDFTVTSRGCKFNASMAWHSPVPCPIPKASDRGGAAVTSGFSEHCAQNKFPAVRRQATSSSPDSSVQPRLLVVVVVGLIIGSMSN